VAPERPSEIGAIAQRIYNKHYADLRGMARSTSLALLGRAFNAGRSPARGELFSYLFFAREFAEELMSCGRKDAGALASPAPRRRPMAAAQVAAVEQCAVLARNATISEAAAITRGPSRSRPPPCGSCRLRT